MTRPSLLLLLPVAACGTPQPPDEAAPTCAWSQGAYAGPLAAGEHLEGAAALGIEGDVLLANPRAAFVIQAPDHERTYYQYGGLPIDAVAMDGCAQRGPERFGELGVLPSRLEIADFPSSVMRQLHGTKLTVVNDGRDGRDAVVTVEGTDDTFWLIDLTLTREVAAGGGRRPLSGPLGVAWTVTYTLPPNSAALRIDVTGRNLLPEKNTVATGVALFPDAATLPFHYANAAQSFAGFGLELGVPWMAASSGDAAFALGFDTNDTALTVVGGVTALFDPAQLLSGSFALAPAGEPGDTATMGMFLAVGDSDAQSAIDALLEARPRVWGKPAQPRPLAGTVTAQEDGRVLAGATVDVEVQRDDGVWRALHHMTTDANGKFHGQIAWPEGDTRPRRLAVRVDGRPAAAPVALDTQDAVDVAVPPGGVLRLHAVDEHGDGLPARVSVYQGAVRVLVTFLHPEGDDVHLPPGDYDVAVTRGYEHEPWREALHVDALGTVTREVSLPRVVDTTGWMSFDGHVHSAPSPDAPLPLDLRFASAAGDGLDVVIHTEHEIIVDETAVLAASPWAGWVASVAGEEVTATTPEHMNMYDVPIGPEDGPRGNPVRWYEQGMGGVLDLMSQRGAGFRTLNHPKTYGACDWMCLINWDPIAAAPRETDPTRFGLPEGTELWSWDLDGIELLNGGEFIFRDPSAPRSSGLFDDWQNFYHHGHRVLAVATSDAHDVDAPGSPRTYVPVTDESIVDFKPASMIAALKAGHATLSLGAFADVHIGAAGIGDTISAPDHKPTLSLRVDGPAAIDVTHVVVFANCDVVADLPVADPHAVTKLHTDVPLTLDRDAQIVVVAFGVEALPLGLQAWAPLAPRALTNPIFVDVDGNGAYDPPGGKVCDYDGHVPTVDDAP